MRSENFSLALASLMACGGHAASAMPPSDPPRDLSSPAVPAASERVTLSQKPPLGGKKLSRAKARLYMVDLINRDRASAGLPPVTLDNAAPTEAGQRHAEDMAASGYLGHVGTDGSVPEQRFTDVGGTDMVLENASCFVDGKPRRLDPEPAIDAKDVEQAESMFFDEVPPNDGHRKNILTPWHTKVGIGVAEPVATASEIPVPCFSQEFVDSYGTYDPIPRQMRVSDTLHVEGTVSAPAVFAGIGLARTHFRAPIPIAERSRKRSYLVPPPYRTYWPAGYKTPIPVTVSAAGHFRVDVPVTEGGVPGMVEVSVWATVPGSRTFVMVSLRTIQVH